MPRDEYGDYSWEFEDFSKKCDCHSGSSARQDNVPITLHYRIFMRNGQEGHRRIISISCPFLHVLSYNGCGSMTRCGNYVAPSHSPHWENYCSCHYDCDLRQSHEDDSR